MTGYMGVVVISDGPSIRQECESRDTNRCLLPSPLIKSINIFLFNCPLIITKGHSNGLIFTPKFV